MNNEMPKWFPIISDALRWVKDYADVRNRDQNDGTDYDGAMESKTKMILECAKNLDSAVELLQEWETGQYDGRKKGYQSYKHQPK